MGIAFYKNTWFTSDWHVGHAQVLNFCKATRPFRDIEHMHEALIENYNKTVKPNQVCYFLGDFAFKGVEYGSQVLSRLHGTKVLILGNHDKGHQSMINMGFDAVLDSVIFKFPEMLITASHFPLKGIRREQVEKFKNHIPGEGWHGEFKNIKQYLVLDDIGQTVHLHGHVHSVGNVGMSERICGKQFDVGVDANNMRPISLNQIIKIMNRRQK